MAKKTSPDVTEETQAPPFEAPAGFEPTEFDASAASIPVAEPVTFELTTAAEPQTADPDEIEIMIDDFCIQLSQSDRRVELIGSFNITEKRAGRIKALPSVLRARFAEFISQPA